jgi:hypothetical protein
MLKAEMAASGGYAAGTTSATSRHVRKAASRAAQLVGTEVMTAELEVVACGRTAWPLWRCAGSGLDVEYISVLVDRAPKIVLLAADADKDLVHVPPVARLRPAPLQHLGEDPAEAQAPLADALVADHDPTLGQDQLNITQAQTEAV